MNLADFRSYVRAYLDVEQEDLPDVLLDTWVREGITRIERSQQRWPFYESTEQLLTIVGQDLYEELDLRTVYTISQGPDGALTRLSETQAEDAFFYGENVARVGRPYAWSQWGTGVRVWPTPDGVYPLVVRGYRQPTRLGVEAGAVPDLPEDFHAVLLSWVMMRAYQHQDYPEEGAVQAQQFEQGLALLAASYLAAEPDEVLVMGGGVKNRHRRAPGAPLGPGLGGWF